MTFVAFHNNTDLKAEKLAQIAAHREADELVQGVGWENGKGCAIGCTLHAYDHALYETELGIPVMLARLEDAIFEGLSNGDAKAWPEQFLAAIKPGADLALVGWQFLHWMLLDLAEKDYAASVKTEIIQSAAVIEPAARGLPIDRAAAARAARAARAAEAAAWAAEAAAWAARAAEAAGAAWAAAWADRWREFRDKLLELLESAPVPGEAA